MSPGFPVYCKPLRQQKKRKDSFPQAPDFCADGISILAIHFGVDNIHLTDKVSLHRIYYLSLLVSDMNYFLLSNISISKYTGPKF